MKPGVKTSINYHFSLRLFYLSLFIIMKKVYYLLTGF